MPGRLSRRRFLGQAAALGAAAAWTPAFRVVTAQAGAPRPPQFPPGIPLYRQAFENWARDIRVDDLWTCAPATPADVVTLANWAAAHRYTLRPRGMMHNWSPLTVVPGTPPDARVVLVDTTQHLTAMRIESSSPPAVTVQAGATMDDLLAFLEAQGYGFTAVPAPGDLTVGGVLAIDGHGAAVPARGEVQVPGHTYGSLSNLVVSLQAVVWSPARRRYVLRTYPRAHPACRAFLTHVGRAFVTQVTLRVGANANLRCLSLVDIPATELFAAPGSRASRTLASYVEASGRVEAIWYAFTECPWLKVWSVSPTKPGTSRHVHSPYNYPFSDRLPLEVTELIHGIVGGARFLTPLFGQSIYDITLVGLPATASQDIWGASKNLLLYIRPTTIRVTANGYAILTRRAEVQRVVSEFATTYLRLVAKYRARDRYPMSVGVEVRVSGLDDPADAGVPGARSPVLSALRPRPDRPDWDTAVWLDILTFPGSPSADDFYCDLETWAYATYSGAYAAVRPEWSKGWAYTARGAFTDMTWLKREIPRAYRAGRRPGDDWDWAVATLNRSDPHRVFSNPFLDVLLPPS